MDDLISRQAAIEGLKDYFSDEARTETEYGAYWHHIHVLQFLEDISPADVRPVVLCKDCDLWNERDSSGRESLGTYRCSCAEWTTEITTYYTGPDEFCSRGVRRDSDG